MLVYGDRTWRADPRALIDRLRKGVAGLGDVPAGIQRHAALVGLFIGAGELTQGLADAAFAQAACDARTDEQDAAMALSVTLAGAVIASWAASTGESLPRQPASVAALDRLCACALPAEIEVKQAEGYAFYALYPEAYAEAAAGLAPRPDAKVIGVRSIGAGLAAMVAATLGAADPVTVRPLGHPFARRLAVSDTLAAELADAPAAEIVIVDEGPGLSGSSLGAVADWAEDQGLASKRLFFFPGHAGDLGPHASERHRQRWATAARPVVSFDALIPQRLAAWVEDLIGPATAPMRDISGGGWRVLRYFDEAQWPAVNTFQERRKFLITTRTGEWLLKFCGLGARSHELLRRAQALSDAGFTPEVVGLRHGFLVQRWLGDARPLGAGIPDRERLTRRLGDYLAFRARRLAAPADAGADPTTLLEMARVNTAEALGAAAARRVEGWASRLDELAASVRRVDTDNRLYRFEWLAMPDGLLLKADAVDHAHAHDLIGCQDIGWDLAGAAVEFDLSEDEQARLCRRVTEGDGEAARLGFYRLCYLAFQLGAHQMALEAHGHWPAEQVRLAAACDHYRRGLADMLGL